MLDFVRLTRDSRLSVRFIEFMPFSGESRRLGSVDIEEKDGDRESERAKWRQRERNGTNADDDNAPGSPGNEWDKQKMVPYNEALGILKQEFGDGLISVSDGDGVGDGTSKQWKVRGWAGEIGFISSMVSFRFVGDRVDRSSLTSLTYCVTARAVERSFLWDVQSIENHGGWELEGLSVR